MSELGKTIETLFEITKQLEVQYAQYERKFTIDGHLLGSIGEVLVAEAFDLELCKSSNPVFDAVTKDEKQTKVQIKATQTKKVSLSGSAGAGKPAKIPQHLIVILIKEDGCWELIYNGPGAPAWENAGKLQKNGQRQISLAKLKTIFEKIPAEKQLPCKKRKGTMEA